MGVGRWNGPFWDGLFLGDVLIFGFFLGDVLFIGWSTPGFFRSAHSRLKRLVGEPSQGLRGSWWRFFGGFLLKITLLGGGFKYFYFHPYLGKWSNLTNIFQVGWNHQLVTVFFAMLMLIRLDMNLANLVFFVFRVDLSQEKWTFEQWKKGPWLFRVNSGWNTNQF